MSKSKSSQYDKSQLLRHSGKIEVEHSTKESRGRGKKLVGWMFLLGGPLIFLAIPFISALLSHRVSPEAIGVAEQVLVYTSFSMVPLGILLIIIGKIQIWKYRCNIRIVK